MTVTRNTRCLTLTALGLGVAATASIEAKSAWEDEATAAANAADVAYGSAAAAASAAASSSGVLPPERAVAAAPSSASSIVAALAAVAAAAAAARAAADARNLALASITVTLGV